MKTSGVNAFFYFIEIFQSAFFRQQLFVKNCFFLGFIIRIFEYGIVLESSRYMP